MREKTLKFLKLLPIKIIEIKSAFDKVQMIE